jgi:hypothetical protein
MKIISVFVTVAVFTLGSCITTELFAVESCYIKDFKTQQYKNACAKGGRYAALEAGKEFMKEKKVKSCNMCHSKLAPSYELKADGLEQFHKLGGK